MRTIADKYTRDDDVADQHAAYGESRSLLRLAFLDCAPFYPLTCFDCAAFISSLTVIFTQTFMGRATQQTTCNNKRFGTSCSGMARRLRT
jgi:hypothetical protein